MLRNIADSLLDSLLETFPPTHAYTRQDLSAGLMPGLVAHFLRQALQSRVDFETERIQEVRSNWFDHNHPDIRQARQALTAAMAAHVWIPAAEWAAELEQAVQTVTTYLVRPTRTLAEFVFGEESAPRSAHAVQRGMAYFAAYPYFRDVVRAYFEEKKLNEIDRARFTTLLSHSDRELTRDYDADAWLRLLSPLFELAGRAAGTQEGKLPVEALLTFFGDKDAHEVVRRLEKDQKYHGAETIDEQHLRNLLAKSAEPVNVYQTPPPPAAAPSLPRSTEPTPQPDPSQPVPLWQQFRHTGAKPAPRPAPTAGPVAIPAMRPPPSAPTSGDKQMPLWMRFRNEPGERTPPLTLTAMELRALGPQGEKNREMFVRNLFSGSTDAYEQVLKQLQTAQSWSEASQIIAEHIFRKHQVNIYNESAIAFTDAVQAQFEK